VPEQDHVARRVGSAYTHLPLVRALALGRSRSGAKPSNRDYRTQP
jgi:hypothetical protein